MPTAERTTPAPRALVWLAILILYVVWGSTYLGIRVAVESIPPFVMASVRFFLAGRLQLVGVRSLRFSPAGGIILGAAAVIQRRSFARPSRVELRDSFIVGALLL